MGFRRVGLAVLACLLVSSTALADEGVEGLVGRALGHNPRLEALAAQVAALEHRTRSVGAWQNPKLQIAYQNVPVESLSLGVEPMSMVLVRLEQQVPFFGKTADREQVSRRATEAKRWELDERRNELRELVVAAYYRLALARQLRALTQGHVELVQNLVEAVRGKYEVGRAPQENLLRLEVHRDRLRDDLADFTRQELQLTAAINAALHRDPDSNIDTPANLDIAAPQLSRAELRSMANENRPALHQLDATGTMHREAAGLAEDEALPDPTVFAAYGFRKELDNGNGGRDLVSFGIGLPLPLFYGSRNGAVASEKLELARASDATRDALLDEIDDTLSRELASWQRAASKVTTYREQIIPAAQRTLEATLASYRVDRADFLSLYETEVDLLNFEKTVRIATVEGLLARARIEKTIGRSLP